MNLVAPSETTSHWRRRFSDYNSGWFQTIFTPQTRETWPKCYLRSPSLMYPKQAHKLQDGRNGSQDSETCLSQWTWQTRTDNKLCYSIMPAKLRTRCLTNTTAGEGEDPFDKAVLGANKLLHSKQKREYEIYVFRQAKHEHNDSISAFHTRLRQLSVTCEFADGDREIKTQIVQSCSSHKLRAKALENPSHTLTQLLDAGQAMAKLSKTQAANIEDKQSVNKLSTCRGNRSPRNRHNYANSNQDGRRPVNKESLSRKSSAKCRNCG